MGGGSRDCPPTKHHKEERNQDVNSNSGSNFWQLSSRIIFRMCIPTRVVTPAVTSTAGFLRANIARISKTRPNPMSQQQQRRFTSMKPTNNTSMPSGHIPVYCLCILPHNAHQFPALSHSPPSNSVTRSPLPLLLTE